MAKKMSKKEVKGYFALAVIGGCIWLAVRFTEIIGGTQNLVVAIAFILAAYVAYKIMSRSNEKRKRQQKRESLLAKYGDSEVVDNIMNKTIWRGQTNEQIVESLGAAEDIDQKVLKTKKKEIWKYGFEGGNRYRLRVTLENNVVVGWENR